MLQIVHFANCPKALVLEPCELFFLYNTLFGPVVAAQAYNRSTLECLGRQVT